MRHMTEGIEKFKHQFNRAGPLNDRHAPKPGEAPKPLKPIEKVKHLFNTADPLDEIHTPQNNESPSSKPLEKPAEFEFHQKRFEKMAEEHANRGWLKRLLDRNAEMTAEDFAHDEALRDLTDFNKRQHAEFKEWEQGLRPVVQHLLEKKKAPENKEIRPLLLILGGGMKGPYSAGQVLGLNEAGITSEVFDTIVGISAGAGAAAYYTAGPEQTRLGTSLFYEECTTPAFINFARLRDIMSINTLMKWMGGPEKKLDEEAIRKSRAKLYFGVTRSDDVNAAAQDPKAEFIEAVSAQPALTSEHSRVLSAMRSSMSVPMVNEEVPPVNGIEYVDGAFDPMPIKALIERFNPTDILVLPNTPFERLDAFQLSKGEYIVAELLKAFGSPGSLLSLGQMEKFLLIKEQMRQSLGYIQKEKGVNIGIVWPPDSALGTFGQKPGEIKSAVLESARGIISVFGKKQPQEIKLYESPTATA